MSANDCDVVIVGARCAGASLATMLAKRGVKVRVLEANSPGTGMAMSTHFLQPPAMDVLDRLGVGAAIRAVTPASKQLRGAYDEEEILAPLVPNRYAYCPRRSTLDPLLQEAAQTAGAEMLYQHTVRELLFEQGRVTGVIVDTPTGTQRITAPLVVGADGPHSIVARQVKAASYLSSECTRAGYWHYFQAPSVWPFPWDATLEHRGDTLRYVFRCDGDQILLITATPQHVASSWGAQHRELTMASLCESPTLGALMEGSEAIGKGCGLLKATFFFREPVGPGWALVGDAGHFKDFVTGQGITDALLDAERLAAAILDGRELAFEHFWRERDVATMPWHFDAIRQGRVGYNNALVRWIYRHLGEREDLRRRFAKVNLREITPAEYLPKGDVLLWLGEALIKGRFDVLGIFKRAQTQMAIETQELRARQAQLDDIRSRIGGSIGLAGVH